MMRKLVKIPLDWQKTRHYFSSHLQEGNTLSKTISEQIDFEFGDFFTLLPHEAILDGLYAFSNGGIIPSLPYGQEKYFASCLNEEVCPGQVQTTDQELSEFIFDFFKKGSKNCAIVEDIIAKSTDAFIKKKMIGVFLNEDEVYYVLNKKNSLSEISQTVRCSSHAWRFLAILSKQLSDSSKGVHEYFKAVCAHCDYIIMGAYDGEAYVFWERHKDGSPKSKSASS